MTPERASVPPRLLPQKEAAAYLGVSLGTFREHVRIEPLRIGRRVLYDRVRLDRWLDEQGNLPQRGNDHWLEKLYADPREGREEGRQ